MSTEYAQPGLKSSVDRIGFTPGGAGLEGRSRGRIAPLPVKVSAPAADPEEPGRFQAGALTQIVEHTGEGQGSLWRARRRGPLGWLDRGLLVAEITCALVVAWLVAQYIYTVYFDTAPHRPAPAQTTAGAVSQAQATRTPLPPTPTIVRGHVPSPAPGELNGVTDPAQMMGPGATPPAAAQEWGGGLPGATATPEPTVDPALLLPKRLRIPAMFLDSPVHEVRINMGTWEVSPMDIGHHQGTGVPGQVGNVVLAGHRDINSALFRELDRLKPGDSVFVSNSFREYRYVVNDSFVVGPNHTEVMDPTDDKRVTLITCTPIGLATQRLIVTATLDESYQAENR